MAQLAIKGHATRGKEVIELLEMLGGSNRYDYSADNDGLCFYINKRTNIIDYDWVNNCYEDEDTFIFTLEEFLEVFPYRVGDKVQHKGATSCVAVYVIERMKWVNNHIEYEIRPLYDYNHTGLVTLCVESLQPYKEETMEEKNNDNWAKWDLPEGYEFQDEKGNAIKTGVIKLVKKQLQYPKTYDECCSVLNIPNDERYIDVDVPLDFNKLLYAFTELLICRNAYWKIAGEQMGLGKPWKPDFTDTKEMYYIFYKGYIEKGNQRHPDNHILIFPTPEMRDAFLENFKDLIELCKELL